MVKREFRRFWRSAAPLLYGSGALAAISFLCFRLQVSSTTTGLFFLIVVVPVSLWADLLPAALVAVIAYTCLDYFFTPPLFALGMNQPLDFLAPIAYLLVALVITHLRKRVRRAAKDQERVEENLRRSQAELAQARRVTTMGELAASIAHEINQPLSAVANSGSACVRWLDGETPNVVEAREAARRIVRDASRAGEVLKRIRAFLQKTDTEKGPVDMNRTIREVVQMTHCEIVANRVDLKMELSSGLPTVLGDRVQLQQVVLNLLMNGVEALAAVSERPRELAISSRRFETGQVLVEVRDSGVGIDRSHSDAIFDAFFTTKAEGMGMGLAISRSIVEDHGGKLWSALDGVPGAKFKFTLPVSEGE